MSAILVTGASSGLGAAFVAALARPGARLRLVARDAARLAAVAEAARAAGAEAETATLDVAEHAALAERILAWDAEAPFSLLLANAGTSFGTRPDGTRETWEEATRQVAVNLSGAIATAGPLLPALRARGAGRIALIASVAAFRGGPDYPGYAASKAGLRAWGEAIRADLAGSGVTLTVACPGFFESAMSARWQGAKPLATSAEAAAARILAATLAGRGRVSFPAATALWLRLADLLPAPLSDAAARAFRTRISPP
jgi:short-subunit dehydrogenase